MLVLLVRYRNERQVSIILHFNHDFNINLSYAAMKYPQSPRQPRLAGLAPVEAHAIGRPALASGALAVLRLHLNGKMQPDDQPTSHVEQRPPHGPHRSSRGARIKSARRGAGGATHALGRTGCRCKGRRLPAGRTQGGPAPVPHLSSGTELRHLRFDRLRYCAFAGLFAVPGQAGRRCWLVQRLATARRQVHRPIPVPLSSRRWWGAERRAERRFVPMLVGFAVFHAPHVEVGRGVGLTGTLRIG